MRQVKTLITRSRENLHQQTDHIDTLISLIRACGTSKNLLEARRLDSLVQATGTHDQDRYLKNLLIEMYGKCGSTSDAYRVFNDLHDKNKYSWSLLMAAYAQNGYIKKAKDAFDDTPVRDVFSWTIMLKAYTDDNFCDSATQVFERMPGRNVVSWTCMLVSYGQCGEFERCKTTFDLMPVRNVFSWTAMVVAFSHHHWSLDQALETFHRIPCWNAVTMNAMVLGYARNGHIEESRETFDRIPEKNIISWTSMVTGYAQNARLEQAKLLFDAMPARNLVAWTSIVAGYAWNGHGQGSMEVFREMELQGEVPDMISFMNVISGCSHVGSLRRGVTFFRSMQEDYDLSPSKEHYCCMVDVLGRSGHLDGAEDLIESMPFVPDEVARATLLAACGIYRDLERAARIADAMLVEDPGHETPYVLLRNIFCEEEATLQS